MARVIGIGHQDFAQLITSGCFYIDKTDFIREWWENQDIVTLIARPRRFGKTLNMSMLERFSSVEYEGQESLQDTVDAALEQIERMNYEAALTAEGISRDRIRRYGFGFEGKRVLIG